MQRRAWTRILVNAPLATLQGVCALIESDHRIEVTVPPRACVTMVSARDSAKGVPFYVGEVLLTECSVRLGDVDGFGAVVGEEAERAYCLAVCDAAYNADVLPDGWDAVLAIEQERAETLQHRESQLIGATRVNFDTKEEVPG